jgi:hypothetical protein
MSRGKAERLVALGRSIQVHRGESQWRLYKRKQDGCAVCVGRAERSRRSRGRKGVEKWGLTLSSLSPDSGSTARCRHVAPFETGKHGLARGSSVWNATSSVFGLQPSAVRGRVKGQRVVCILCAPGGSSCYTSTAKARAELMIEQKQQAKATGTRSGLSRGSAWHRGALGGAAVLVRIAS